ncbi:MAG TPA: DNA-directed RNA polymerase subunit beta' [Fimbriimonadales bacterium]|nr:DNA-directed RNA polymerase subunit beta' [Fimbriimonadales bacterium]
MPDVSIFDKIRLSIASPEDIVAWSHGEVKKPETINYRTFKPERDGLFCERIFGPVKDWECHCGRYKKVKYKGIVCERCGVEVTRSRVRRERMGHIELAAPVCHIWYLKSVPSPIALLLNLSPRDLEKVVYFGSFIVIEIDRESLDAARDEIEKAVEDEKLAIQQQAEELEHEIREELARELEENKDEYDEATIRERTKAVNDRIKAEQRDANDRIKEMDVALEVLYKLEPNMLIEEDKYRAVVRMLQAVTRRLGRNFSNMLRAEIGAAAVKELLSRVALEPLAKELKHIILTTTGPKRARAIKRLEIVEAFLHSKAKPEWMVLENLPVISPELRPMVQLDGGRFATSDLNDLYRRIINRNNRLRKIQEIRAPESIINHEKRLLQEAVDALIDNGRRSRPVVGSNNRPLKSLSDMLKGKEGRFRKNLLGKRVDYSGRAVIVVGPHLKLHQCGIPKEMALELFKPYVMRTLVEEKLTPNIKTAKRMIDRMHPEVWDALEKVIKDYPVLLNRAPTLHRFGIQAFEPVLVDGKAIQIHPLVCPPYNADFDGDQMAVHVPLSVAAQAEARILMLSSNNLFSPANGQPTMTPMQDIVLGCYGLTLVHREAKEKFHAALEAHRKNPTQNPPPRTYSSPEEAISLATHPDISVRIPLNAPVFVRLTRPVGPPKEDGTQEYETVIREMTPGQMIFHEILPFPLKYHDDWINVEMSKRNITRLITEAKEKLDSQAVVEMLDRIKELGFEWATRYGFTITVADVDPLSAPTSDRSLIATMAKEWRQGVMPTHYSETYARSRAASRLGELIEKKIGDSQKETRVVRNRYELGGIARNERDRNLMNIWGDTFGDLSESIINEMGQFNPLRMMVESGARGSKEQLVQLMATRGMFRNNFNQPITDIVGGNGLLAGSRVFEYFVSMFGTRKGVTDTALLMGYSGFIARRLVDVSHDVVINAEDCGTTSGVYVSRIESDNDVIETLRERVRGRTAVEDIYDPRNKEKKKIVAANEVIDDKTADILEQISETYYKARSEAKTAEDPKKVISTLENTYRKAGFRIGEHGELQVTIRSPLTCDLEKGICSKCYGWDLSTSRLAEKGLAVGVIAAETMSEPLSQLTMRTFHHGGVALGTVLTGYTQAGRMYGTLHQEMKADIVRDESALETWPDFVSEQKSVIEGLMGKEKNGEEKPAKGAKSKAKKTDQPPRVSTANRQLARELVEHSLYHYVGIPFVERLLEARRAPKGEAVISRYGGEVIKIESGALGRWVVIKGELPIDSEELPGKPIAEEIRHPETKEVLFQPGTELTKSAIERLAKLGIEKVKVLEILLLPKRRILLIKEGDIVKPGDPLTQGPMELNGLLEFRGIRAVQEYLIKELQSLYKSNGVNINDRHLEIICRQMLRKVKIRDAGDSKFLPGQIVDRFALRRENERIQAMIDAGEQIEAEDPITGEFVRRTPRLATADPVIQGITEAALTTDSFLSAASAQKTVRVLTEASVKGKTDELVGLKENVIIGRLIPAGSGFPAYRNIQVKTTREPVWAKTAISALASMQEKELPEEAEEVEEGDIGDIRSLAESLGAEPKSTEEKGQ